MHDSNYIDQALVAASLPIHVAVYEAGPLESGPQWLILTLDMNDQWCSTAEEAMACYRAARARALDMRARQALARERRFPGHTQKKA